MEVAFRKIDIDIYDEDVLDERELYTPDPRPPAQILAETKEKNGTVRGFLARGDIGGALNAVLENAPYGSGDAQIEEAKTVNLQTLLTILGSTKAADIPALVRGLSGEGQDTLMKYLYKGMGVQGWGDVSGSVLLGWHEKLTEVAGTGCIVRVMTDRRAV